MGTSMYPWKSVKGHCVQNRLWRTPIKAREVIICDVPNDISEVVCHERGDHNSVTIAYMHNENRIIMHRASEIFLDLGKYGLDFLMRLFVSERGQLQVERINR